MNHGTPTTNELDEILLREGGVAGTLISLKNEIFDRFVAAVRNEVAEGADRARPLIVNTLPTFVTALGVALSPNRSRQWATDGSSVAQTHGEERATLTGYDLDDLIHEYQLLRSVLFDCLSSKHQLTSAEIATVNSSIDRAVRQAASAFVAVHDTLRSQMAATLTHDLRGPLGAASNYIQLVRRESQDADAREKHCKSALRNLDRVRQMVEDLLDTSRASAGEALQLRLEPVAFRSLIEEVLTDLGAAHGTALTINADDEIHGVASGDALKRAISNLVENAIKYGDREDPVVITLDELQDNVYISVHNGGPAIPAELRESLFSPFRRGPSAGEGWGLGLTAVKQIAAAHGGSITVESSEEEGTTFTLQIFKDASRFSADQRARG